MPFRCEICKTTSSSLWTGTRDGIHCAACQHTYEETKNAEHKEGEHYKKRGLVFPDDILAPKK